jgi:hypothetical protein
VVKVKAAAAGRMVKVAVAKGSKRVSGARVVIAVRGTRYVARTSSRGIAKFVVRKHGKVRVVSPR